MVARSTAEHAGAVELRLSPKPDALAHQQGTPVPAAARDAGNGNEACQLKALQPLARLPLSVKIGHSALVAVIVPVYWREYGPQNFLWFSDVALLLAVPALWLQHRLLASMQAIAIAVPEAIWTLGFLAALILGTPVFGLAEYMFDPSIPLAAKTVSLAEDISQPPLVLFVDLNEPGEEVEMQRACALLCGPRHAQLFSTGVPTRDARPVPGAYGLTRERLTCLERVRHRAGGRA